MTLCKAGLAVIGFQALFGAVVLAQSPKDLKVLSGKSVVVINLISTHNDCSSNPGPIAVPVIREKPMNGVIQMQIVITAVPPAGGCPARKVPTAALIYTPNKGFIGSDAVSIELEEGNKATTLGYRITVQPNSESL
jgi:hypothetical protein